MFMGSPKQGCGYHQQDVDTPHLLSCLLPYMALCTDTYIIFVTIIPAISYQWRLGRCRRFGRQVTVIQELVNML